LVDFRYHALSLVAVFLALGIGIVLGVTVGDSLVSEADQNLRDSLRDDVTEAREDARNEQELGTRRDEVIDETSQAVAEGRPRQPHVRREHRAHRRPGPAGRAACAEHAPPAASRQAHRASDRARRASEVAARGRAAPVQRQL
jgi:hypothetical protein